MSVSELNELVKALEERFGVSAAAMSAAPAAAAEGAGEAAEAKDSFNLLLKAAGDQKIAVIKIVKEVLALGLAEAKTMVEGAPVMMKQGVKKELAEEWKKKIETAGGKVTLK